VHDVFSPLNTMRHGILPLPLHEMKWYYTQNAECHRFVIRCGKSRIV